MGARSTKPEKPVNASSIQVHIPKDIQAINYSSRRFDSLQAGMKLSYIVDFATKNQSAFQGWTVCDLCYKYIKPLCNPFDLSFCEYINEKVCVHGAVANAEVFISYAWGYTFLDVVATLKHHFEATPDIYIWFDVFSKNQNIATEKPFEWWTHVFKSAVETIGYVVMIIHPWNDPVVFKRAWCLFELYCAKVTNVRFEFAFGPAEREKFLKEFTENSGSYEKMLAEINLFSAECSVPSDKEAIVAFAKAANDLHEYIFTLIRDWIFEVSIAAVNEEIGSLRTTLTRYQLGLLFLNHGQLDNARRLLTMDVFTRIVLNFGVQSQYAFTAAQRFSQLYVSLGQFEEARAYLEDIRIVSDLIDKDSEASLSVRNSLALIMAYQGNFEDAKSFAHYCLQKRKELLGNDHPNTLETELVLAYIYVLKKNYFVAGTYFGPLFYRYIEAFGQGHPKVKTFLMFFAISLMGQGQLDPAKDLFKTVYLDLKMLYGRKHAQVEFALTNLCFILWGIAHYEECEQFTKQLLDLHEEIAPSNLTLRTKADLAAVYAVLLRHDLAEQLFSELYHALSAQSNNELLDTVKHNMKLYFSSCNKMDKIAEFGLETFQCDDFNLSEFHVTENPRSSYLAIFRSPNFFPYT